MTLDLMKPGESGVVCSLAGEGPLIQRLAEMGLVAGAQCRVIRFAPLGDPMEILLDGYHLSLRKSEARCVGIVTPPVVIASDHRERSNLF